MNLNLINYIGVDFDNNKKYIYKCSYKLDGILNINNTLNELFSFSVIKKNLGYKTINFFNDSNFEDELYFGNLVIVTNYFQLNFEYASCDSPSKIKFLSYDLYDATHISMPNYNNEDLSIKLYICDLFCSLLENNSIYYCIDILLCINKK